MKCSNCQKETFALFDGHCKFCFSMRKPEVLELPKHKPKGIATRKRLKTHKRGLYIVRVREGVYLNTGRKNPLVDRASAYIYTMSDWAEKAAKRVRGKVEIL